MRDRLEDQGVPDAEIDRRVARARESLRERQNGGTRMHLALAPKSCRRRRHGCGIHAKERKAEGRVGMREDHVDANPSTPRPSSAGASRIGLRWSATERSSRRRERPSGKPSGGRRSGGGRGGSRASGCSEEEAEALERKRRKRIERRLRRRFEQTGDDQPPPSRDVVAAPR